MINCLYCGESRSAIRASQKTHQPIYCGAVDYFGEVEWERDRHRFRSWTDNELWNMGIDPQYYELYRRLVSQWEIDPAHSRFQGASNE